MVFQALICLDFSSHWFHMYSSLLTGNASHKKVDEKQSWLLYQYYTNRVSRQMAVPVQADPKAERLVHCLRPQRALLHRTLPALLLVTATVARPTWSNRRRHVCSAGIAEAAEEHLSQPLVCGGNGAGSCQQDRQHCALDPCGYIISRHGVQAVAECRATYQRLQNACRGRPRSKEASKA